VYCNFSVGIRCRPLNTTVTLTLLNVICDWQITLVCYICTGWMNGEWYVFLVTNWLYFTVTQFLHICTWKSPLNRCIHITVCLYRFPKSLWKRLLNPYNLTSVKSIAWGITHEATAIAQYCSYGASVISTGWLYSRETMCQLYYVMQAWVLHVININTLRILSQNRNRIMNWLSLFSKVGVWIKNF